MCDRCNHQNQGGFLGGIVLGSIIGAAGFLLLNSEEGKKLQKKLQKKTAPYINDIAEVLEELKDQSSELLDKAEEVKESLQEKIEDKKEKIEEVVADKLESSLTHIEALQERGREATASIRKRFFKNTKKPAS
jgi:gas vesicle protein